MLLPENKEFIKDPAFALDLHFITYGKRTLKQMRQRL